MRYDARVFRIRRQVEDGVYLDPEKLERAAQRCTDRILETIRNHMSPSVRVILPKERTHGNG